ncbi:ATP-binding protein [Halorhodospira halochloris]|uniref:ATP-binding protein n=1 Tax=Halorhodospira halochloris TaxID=1052 RepID=UPI001EE8866B|nr:ATP-binding protein [Halorhodospira halochloris]MCG5531012.1 ATP-binding protein [Halorhodospira halochloris]
MNPFVDSLANYIQKEWDRVLSLSQRPREARFIIQSLGPRSTFELFHKLEQHKAKWQKEAQIECHFRVATALWRDWRNEPNQGADYLDNRMRVLGGMAQDGQRNWIDEEDRLTWYRNRTCPEDHDGLIVALVGLNHATDQGGLSAFHRVDESRIWQQQMERSFMCWLQQLNDDLGLDNAQNDMERLDRILDTLFTERPLQLERLGEFLADTIVSDGHGLYKIKDIESRLFANLPFWDLPPLFNQPKNVKDAERRIKDAANFISHRRFRNSSDQNRAWDKLQKAFNDGNISEPQVAADGTEYNDITEYKDTLNKFIFNGDAQARQRLLKTDIGEVLDILKQKTTSSSSSKQKVHRLNRLISMQAFLRAIWKTLELKDDTPLFSSAYELSRIEIELDKFSHDLTSDDSNNQTNHQLAQELLQSCLGGIDRELENIDFRLPEDGDQAQQHPDNWEKYVPIALDLDLDNLTYGTGRQRPNLQFKVKAFIEKRDGEGETEHEKKLTFQWSFEPTHPERIRSEAAKAVLTDWEQHPEPRRLLPAWQIPPDAMTAMYYAADEEEANRLVSNSLTELKTVNLLEGFNPGDNIDTELWQQSLELSQAYRDWLHSAATKGYYYAISNCFDPIIKAYERLTATALDTQKLGGSELLRRLYKAFLLFDTNVNINDHYLRSAMVLGISPPVLDLMRYRLRFLCDGFPEVAAKLALEGSGQKQFERLLQLSEIHRPLAGLVVDADRRLSAEIKSFGLIHHLGAQPDDSAKSLAVQTLLRDDEIDDDEEDISDIVAPNETRDLVHRVLQDYQQLYPFATDGLRILALHVDELGTILSGVDSFLRKYLKGSTSQNWPAFHCEVMIYTTSSSPMAMESRLNAWRQKVSYDHRESGRELVLNVAHRYAPNREKMQQMLRQEIKLYDIAFLFHFLQGELTADVEPAQPFEYNFNATNISPFPICEYPRPIKNDDALTRKSLFSNRRLRIQTRHADLSARLCHPHDSSDEHLIYGRIHYNRWSEVVEQLHQHAQWVACIDPFIDKRLIRSTEQGADAAVAHNRKIVGFTSGLGDYGELNLAISTEQDTLQSLNDLVYGQLIDLLPFLSGEDLKEIATNVVDEAEEIIGLASLHAVVGETERIREVVGFSMIRRALATPEADIVQLLPIDSLQHWFEDNEESGTRPDLLQLALIPREDDVPLLKATLIECKLGQSNKAHIDKAYDQIRDGLSHLTRLLAPDREDIHGLTFDRRYWWAQLQRAVTSRAVVNMPDSQWKVLDQALESLAEGIFEIEWQAAIFACWTDDQNESPVIEKIPLAPGAVNAPAEHPDNFAIHCISIGYPALHRLFTADSDSADELRGGISLEGQAIRLRPYLQGFTQSIANAERGRSTSAVEPPRATEQPTFEDNVVDLYERRWQQRQQESHQSQDQERTTAAASQSGSNSGQVTPTGSQTYRGCSTADRHDHEWPQVADNEQTSHGNPQTVDSGTKPSQPTIPDKLLIGTRGNQQQPVYWHYGHPKLNNRHLLILGTSGSGKTYAIQCLLAEMAAQQLHSLIIDYTDGFLPAHMEPPFEQIAKPETHFVRHYKLPLSPFRPQRLQADPSLPETEETPYDIAGRIASIFTALYSTMGEQQKATFMRVIEDGVATSSGFNFHELHQRLKGEGQHGETLANKIEPLIKADPFREGENAAWDEMLSSSEHRVQILQLATMSRNVQRLITEMVLWDLYDYAKNNGSKYRPIPVVLDEIHSLDHSSDSPIDKMLREGRKFGLSMILATQTIKDLTQEARGRLFQSAHKLIFRPADNEIDAFAKLLSDISSYSKNEWNSRLSDLHKGQCWSIGPAMTTSGNLTQEEILVSVTPFEEREILRGQ